MADEKTKEQKEKEQMRDVALKNLKLKELVDIGTSYLVHKTKSYGDLDNSAMEQYKYFPAFNSGAKAYDKKGEEYDIIQNSILGSREEGERYSGNVSELKIMKECAAIMSESLNSIKVSDLVDFIGSKINLKEKFKDAYVSDFAPKKMKREEMDKLSEDQKKAMKDSAEIYQNLIGSYQTYLAQTKVSEALAESAKEIPKGLEEILAEPKEENKK